MTLVAKKAGMQNVHCAHPQDLQPIPDITSNFVQIQSGVRDLIIGRGCINQPETKGEHLPIAI